MVMQAVGLGLVADKASKKIAGNEVSAARTAISTGLGVALGAAASGSLVLASVVSAPITVPLAIASGGFAFLASRFK